MADDAPGELDAPARPGGEVPRRTLYPYIVDPDVDLHDPDQRSELRRHEVRVLGAVAAGGVVGAEARYGLALALPHAPAAFPWAVLLTNVIGCVLIGVLMTVLLDVVPRPHPLARPLLGVGVLGGFTTFSTFAVDTDRLVHLHRPWLAAGYVAASLLACLAGVALAVAATRAVLVDRRA